MTAGSVPQAVRRFLSARVAEGFMAGAAWSLETAGGPIDRGAVGWAVREPHSCELDESTPFDLASLTKPLCTALLLVLEESAGRIDPRRPVADWLDELGGSWIGQASLVELATHAARLPAWHPLYLQAGDREGYLRRIAASSPAVPAGQTLYSDLGYILLGIVLERARGERLDRLFDAAVARPLGLRRLGFAVDGSGYEDAAATEWGNVHERAMAGAEGAGHAWRTRVLRGEVHDANAWGLGGVAGHAGLFGTVEEVAALGGEILRPRRLALDPAARRRLLVPTPERGGRTVGWVLASHSAATRGILPDGAPGHTGFTGTSLWLDPPSGRVYVLLTNRVHPRVPNRDFRLVRRAFHRLGSRLLVGAERTRPLQ